MADKDLEINVRTTADTTGIQQTREQLEKLRQDAGAKALFAEIPPGGLPKAPPKEAEGAGEELAGHIGKGFERVALHAVGVGAVLETINAIKQMAEEINKITDALDKEGEQLVRHAQHYEEAARAATSEADVLKIARSALSDMDAIQDKIHDTLKEEVSTTGKWVDSFGHLVQLVRSFGTAAKEEGRINEQVIAKKLEGELEHAKTADKNARRAIQLAKEAQETFERREELPIAEAIAETTADINKLKAEQKGLNEASEDYVRDWVRITGQIEAADNVMRKLLAHERERVQAAKQAQKAADEQRHFIDAAAASASNQAKAILANEEAARRSRQKGQERDADMYQKTAEQLKKSATPEELEEYEGLKKALGPGEPRPGRKAEIGESQELVDQMERNRKAFEEQLKPTPQPMVETGTGGPSMTGAEAERARKDAVEDERARQKRETPGKQPGAASAEAIKENTAWLQKLYQLWA